MSGHLAFIVSSLARFLPYLNDVEPQTLADLERMMGVVFTVSACHAWVGYHSRLLHLILAP